MRRADLLCAMKASHSFLLCSQGILAISIALASSLHAANKVVSYETAAAVGLQRAWFAQIGVDGTRSRVENWILHNEHLYALTSTGTIHALNSRTGKTMWVSQVGTPGHPVAGPAINSNYVAVVSSSRLYVLDRADGHVVWSRRLGSVSGTAPALSESHVYVPLLSGRVEGYALDDPFAAAWQFQSIGRIFDPAITTGRFLTWSTDRGYLYVGDSARPRVLFRVETNDEIVSAPVSLGTNIYASSLRGYLYCYNESSGEPIWRYSTGYPISRPPVVVGGKAFVASEEPTLYAVDPADGSHLWATEGAVQFVSLGSDRVYAWDRFGALLALDDQSGTVAGKIAVGEGTTALSNDQSDRIYLVNDTGLVQCLHETGASEPTLYNNEEDGEAPPTDAEPSAPAEESASDSTEETSSEEENGPFGSEEPEESEEDGDVFDDDNPFG